MNKGRLIEKESFDIIERNCDLSNFDKDEREIVKRAIHASGDFEFAKLIKFSKGWKDSFLNTVKGNCVVVCDVNMVKAGITEKYLTVSGMKSYCFISDGKVIEKAGLLNKTRAEVSVDYAFEKFENIVFVVGNAPTFLLRVLEKHKDFSGKYFVVGVPVGFVKASESKEMLMKSELPHISNMGTKGGSGIAAAIFNGIIKVIYGI